MSNDINNNLSGFRLSKLEVLNWGTFSRNVWKIEPNGFNSLLTGDIGSGKSTLVDAVTTLLVPNQKIVYNKAAGAENKERTIYTYIRGEYKNERDEENNSKSVFLREEDSYSVLLAYFDNIAYSEGFTLAQVFWLKNNKAEKFFVISDRELSISEHFSDFGKDIANLKKNLKKYSDVFDSFIEYSIKFRHLFGVKSEKALDLFYQTVSMKSVGNLTDFVRNQMLEKFDVKSKLEELKKHFEDLTEAHNSVLKARDQIEMLDPLLKEAEKFDKITNDINELSNCMEALSTYFSAEKANLLSDEISFLSEESIKLEYRINELIDTVEKLRREEVETEVSIKNNELGKRLSLISDETKVAIKRKDLKLKEANKYAQLAISLGLPEVIDENIFYQSLYNARVFESNIINSIPKLVVERDNLKIKLNHEKKSYQDLVLEFESLKQRKNQLPDINLKIRESILRELGLWEHELPFVGEIIKVKDYEREWEGAIERLLHNFGLSMLVPEEHYKKVSDYVDRTNLRGRLVYYRIPNETKRFRNIDPEFGSLPSKVEIKSDTNFYSWIENELYEKFNYSCCETIEQFQREPYAITKTGQMKSGKYRHEKDDRRNIFDRKNFILGWSNIEKLKVLGMELIEMEEGINNIELEIKNVEKRQDSLIHRRDNIRDFIKYTDFSEINWKKEALEINKLNEEKHSLENSSDELKSLNDHLENLKLLIATKSGETDQSNRYKGKLESDLKDYNLELAECIRTLELHDAEKHKSYFQMLEPFVKDSPFILKTMNRVQNEVRRKIEDQKELKYQEEMVLRDLIISIMGDYKNKYLAETKEVDKQIESLPEFLLMAKRLHEDDLPRHERRFKKLLNERTIQGIVLFKNQLEIYEKDIEDKIRDINKSLVQIDYNPGTYITLDGLKSTDIQVREFKNDLRNCLENSFGGVDYYNEDKFNQVKSIIDRFNSGKPEDINWTNKVTDVRNWFAFTVSERWKEDNTLKEFYSDSSGKSGGQKEKLAYTILASALAYQFGLEWGETKSKSFRFVVIDEAFGRGSDESTRYGLELFKKLNLQLLIITPLQKINIIEDYISSVHFVSNTDGMNSKVRNLTIKEYQEEKEKFLSLAGASV